MEITELPEGVSDATIALDEDITESEEARLDSLVAIVMNRFEDAKVGRLEHEVRWAKAYANYRALTDREIPFTDTEKSKAVVKITKTKVLAAYGQIIDVLFGSGRLPISIEATPDPIGIEKEVNIEVKDAIQDPQAFLQKQEESVIGFEGDGKELAPGDTFANKLGNFLSGQLRGLKVKKGVGEPQTSINISPSEEAAKRMDTKIHDQLVESKAEIVTSSAILEMVMLGTGVVKGPFLTNKEYPRWEVSAENENQSVYNPVIKPVPEIEKNSIWNIYLDPESRTFDAQDSEYLIDRHMMVKTQLRQLKSRPHFRKEAIEDAILRGVTDERLWWENQIRDTDTSNSRNRYEVLEYWGTIDREAVEKDQQVDIPEDLEDVDEFQVNVWVCNGIVLRVVFNPFKPRRIPYFLLPYEVNPYSPYGIGLAENMEDSQTLMNGFVRLAVDNAVMAGNLIIEVDETNLVAGQDIVVHPGKIFRREGGAPGQAIFGTKWPNTMTENFQAFDRFRQLADEETGIPSFSHGQTGITSTNRTASGVSMLLGAAALATKTAMKNIDNFLLQPLGEAMFAFNMQFNFDPSIKGDLEVKASGMSSLLKKEVQSQRILQFIQTASNPITAPWANMEYLMKQAAESLELDPEKAVNDPKKAQIAAQILQQSQGGPQGAAGQAAQQNQGTPQDPTQDPNQVGGGQIAGGGAPPVPGSDGFTGQPQAIPNGR